MDSKELSVQDRRLASPKAFISYAHEDRASAIWIAVELGAVGMEVFRDEERLSTGDVLSATLQREIGDIDVLVLIATAEGLASSWTRREFDWARQVGRRICFIYWSIVPTEQWPELADLLGVDAAPSLASVVTGTISALPGFAGKATRLDTAIERRGADLNFCAELLMDISRAISRHINTGTWVDEFSLESCFLWTAQSGSPPLSDTHVIVVPAQAAELTMSVEARPLRESVVVAGDRVRIEAVWNSVGSIADRLLQIILGQTILPGESPSNAFTRLKIAVPRVDHKRLFTFLCLVHDLKQKPLRLGLATLLEEIQERCIVAESPPPGHSSAFWTMFVPEAPKENLNVSVIVITHAGNPKIIACLDSIFQQTCFPAEVILVEDSPSPSSGAFEIYPIAEHLCLPQSRTGVSRRSRCRRVGTKVASCPVLLYVDGDAIISPSVVESIVAWWQDRDPEEGCLSLLVPDVELQAPEPPLEVTYDWVCDQFAKGLSPAPGLYSSSGVGIIRSWYDSSATLGSGGHKVSETLSWRNVRSRCWSVMRDDVIGVGNWDGAYEGWGTEETDLAYRLHLHRAMRVRMLSLKGTYAVHVAHAFDREVRTVEHARNEARLINKFPNLRAERMALARRLGIAQLVETFIDQY